jgi:hypothetical protein
MKLFLLLLPYFAAGLAFTLVAVLIERLMIITGWVRGNTVFLAISVFILSIVLELIKFPSTISLGILDFFVLCILAPLKLNQIDLIGTIEKGRWWWKAENTPHK